MTNSPKARRVRWPLLALLWVWAGSMALVLDLFLNVPELDRVRPRARAYRAARYTAHELVGEPYAEDDEFARAGAWRPPVRVRAAGNAAARPEGSRPHRVALVGGRIDASTPLGARILSGLARMAESDADPARRAAAAESLAVLFDEGGLRGPGAPGGADTQKPGAAR